MSKIHVHAVGLFALLLLSVLAPIPTALAAEAPNQDIVVTSYTTTVLEQGKSGVAPVFTIKNNGTRAYQNVQVLWVAPLISGRNISVPLQRGRRNLIRLEPGEEVVYIASSSGFLATMPDQMKGLYESTYFIAFEGEDKKKFQTAKIRDKKFVEVIPFNADIASTGFTPVVMEQGKSKVAPQFKIKNSGKQIYKKVQILLSAPALPAKNVKLRLERTRPNLVTLNPGEELEYLANSAGSLTAAPDQPLGAYEVEYYIQFETEDGTRFRTPIVRIPAAVKIVPFNPDLVIAGHTLDALEQGKSKVAPLFKLKNNGKQAYRNVQVIYSAPGLPAKNVTLRFERAHRNLVQLDPGEELEYLATSPGYLAVNENQPLGAYESRYYLQFEDQAGAAYRTPEIVNKAFVQVVPFNGDVVASAYTTTVLEQGQAKIAPQFTIENKGKRKYKNVQILWTAPAQPAQNSKIRQERGSRHLILLDPGEKAEYLATSSGYLNAAKNQPLGTYETLYQLIFEDEEGATYKTPQVRIKSFVEVVKPGGAGAAKRETLTQPPSPGK